MFGLIGHREQEPCREEFKSSGMVRDTDDDDVLFKKKQKTKNGSISSHSAAECGVSSPTKQLWQIPSSPNDLTSVGEPYLVLIDVQNKTVSFTWISSLGELQ